MNFSFLGSEKVQKGTIATMVCVHGEMWCASKDKKIYIFRSEAKLNRVIEGHMGNISCIIAFGGYVWSCGFDKHILIWNPVNSKCINFICGVHKDTITTMCVVKKSPEKYQIWSGSGSLDGHICIYKTSPSKKTAKMVLPRQGTALFTFENQNNSIVQSTRPMFRNSSQPVLKTSTKKTGDKEGSSS